MTTEQVQQIFVLLIGLFILFALTHRQPWKPSGYAHGTARWSSEYFLHRAGMFSGNGLILGRTLRKNQLLRLHKYVHTAVIAPSGAGKGVSCVIPNLLTYDRGSVFVFDPKGELYRITSDTRRKMGKVYILDPFGICTKETDHFNPFDFILPDDPTLIDQARALAESIVVRNPEGDKEPFWNDSAVILLTALITATLIFTKGEYRNLETVRTTMSNPELFGKALKSLQSVADVPPSLAGQVLTLMKSEKTTADVTTTACTHTAFVDSKAITDVLSKSTFSPDVLLTPGATIYLVLPPEHLEAQRNFLRLIVSSLIRHVTRHGVSNWGETLFVLDECASLAGLEPLEQAFQLGRGSGIRVFSFWQSVEQAQAAFKKTPNLVLDNSDAKVFFGVSTYTTAELVSKMLGSWTMTIDSFNISESRSNTVSPGPQGTSRSYNKSWSNSRNISEHARSLLKPEEVMQLSENLAIAFVKGVPPILFRRIKYFSDRLFNPRRSIPCIWIAIIFALLILWAI